MKPYAPAKPNRYKWIDYARGIAIALVVYRHAFEGIKRAGFAIDHYMFLEYANVFFFSFRMPLFFIVSGVFVAGSLYKRGLAKFFVNKCKVILYPYFLWGTLQITLQLIFGSYLSSQRSITHYFNLFYLPREVDQFWYLYALFNVSVLYAFIKVKLRFTHIYQLVLGLVLYLISAYNTQHHIDLGFVNDICHYYIFFALGDALSNYIRSAKSETFFASWKLFYVLLPLFIAAQLYFLLVNMQHNSDKYVYVEYYQPFMYLLIALIGCALVMNISFMLQQRSAADWIRRMGFYSLYIYVCHVMVTSSTRIVLSKFLGIDNVVVLLAVCIVLGIIVPILLYTVAQKLNMAWLFKLGESEPKKTTDTITEKPVVSTPV